jgi:hypothetical protein
MHYRDSENVDLVAAVQPEPNLLNFRSMRFVGRESVVGHICVCSHSVERCGLHDNVSSKGRAWSSQREFDVAGNRHSYQTLIEVKPGRRLAVWDRSNRRQAKRSAMHFGRLQVQK